MVRDNERVSQKTRVNAGRLRVVLFVVLLYAITGGVVGYAIWNDQRNDVGWTWLRVAAIVVFIPSLVKYYLQVLTAPFFVLFMRRQERIYPDFPDGEHPNVSVLVPAWNEEVGVLTTLRSLERSTWTDFEVVVVNDGSTDNTRGAVLGYVVGAAGRRPDMKVRYVEQPNGGKVRAMNNGLGQAAGDIIVTIDADSVVEPDTLTNLVKHYRRPDVSSVAGNVKIGNPQSVIGVVQQLEYMFGFYFKQADTILNTIYIVGGAAASYRRSAIEAVGGFDPTIITEDIELSTRIQAAGGRIEYAPDAIVYTEGPTTITGLCKQRLRWKYGRLLTFGRYRKLFFSFKRSHSTLLTWFILPIAFFSELLLLLEVPLLVVFYGYMFTSGDFLPMFFSIAITAVVIAVQVLTDPRRRTMLPMLWLAPVAWLIFYVVDAVEFQSLVRSLWKLARKQEVVWQKWNRTGVFAGENTPLV